MNAFTAKCKCQHCNQNIEFPVGRAGECIACPGCGMETILFIPASMPKATAAETPSSGKNVALVLVIIAVLAALGFVTAVSDKEDIHVNPVLVLFIGLAGGILYFIPALLGSSKRQFPAILALNLLLGWSLFGWVGALVWALVKEKSDS
jgi:hypothetical protein